MSGIDQLKYYINLILQMSYAELRAEASRSYLSFLWWFLEPVMYMIIFYLIFQSGLRGSKEGFLPFLLCGLVSWKWFSSSVVGGSVSLIKYIVVIRQIYLPKIIFPFVIIFTNTFKFFLVLCVLLIFLVTVFEEEVTVTWFALPLIIMLQLLFIISSTILVSAIIPFAQDLKLLLDNLVIMLFFLSGVFFDIDNLVGSAEFILKLNPMAVIIETYRLILLFNEWPDWSSFSSVLLLSLLILYIGISIKTKFNKVYPKIIN